MFHLYGSGLKPCTLPLRPLQFKHTKDLQLVSTYEQEHRSFVFLGWSYFNQYIFFNSSISYKVHLYLGLYKMALCICTTFPLFPSDEHLVWFHFLTVVNRVTMSMGMKYIYNGFRWVIWKFYFQRFLKLNLLIYFTF